MTVILQTKIDQFKRQKGQIALTFGLTMLSAVLFMSLFLYSTLKQRLYDQALRDLENQTTNFFASHFNHEIEKTQKGMEQLAQDPQFKSLEHQDQIQPKLNGLPEGMEEEKRKLLSRFLRSSPHFSVMYLTNKEGDVYLAQPYRVQEAMTLSNLSQRPYFQHAKFTNRPAISNGFVGADGRKAVVVLVPLLDAVGEAYGYLGGVIHLDRFVQWIEPSHFNAVDQGYVLDGLGNVLNQQQLDSKDNPSLVNLKSVPLVAEYLASKSKFNRPKALTATYLDPNTNQRYLGSIAPLVNGWSVFMGQDAHKVNVEIHNQIGPILLSVILMLVGVGGVGLLIVGRIESQRSRVQEELIKSRSLLAESQKLTKIGSWEWDIPADRRYWSEEMYAIFERNKGDSVTTSQWLEYLHPEDREKTYQALRDSLKKGTEFRRTYRIICPSGKEKLLSSIGKAVQGEAGQTERMMGTLQDITEIKAIDEKLHLLSQAVEQSPVSIVITNREGSIQYANPFFCRVTGYSQAEVQGANPRILKSGKQGQEIYQELWDKISKGKQWFGELHNKKKSGELYWESVYITPIFDSEGKINSFLGIKQDITKQKYASEELMLHREHLEEMVVERTSELIRAKNDLEEAYSKLQSLDELKDDFVATVSHELRTPLASILGYAETIRDCDLKQEDTKRFSGVIISEAERLTLLIANVLDLSAITAGSLEFDFEETSLQTVIRRAVGAVSGLLLEKNEISILPEATELSFEGDADRITQVLINLLANAIKYSPEPGEIFIRVEPKPESFMVAIQDQGPGIPQDLIENMFSRFSRVQRKGLQKKGTGLGLAISKGIVEAHYGRIWVENREDSGANFCFELPLRHQAPRR